MRLAFRDIELDPDRFELTRGGEPVRLEPQAFEVLAHLVQHRDRVVTRDELMEAVWGSLYVSDAALATRIKEARRALGDDGTSQWAIRTIHRRGYRFIADVEDGTPAEPRHEPPPAYAPAAASGTPRPAGSGTVRPPIGREAEFARLAQAHRSLAERGTQVLFITGEAGIGKSTLVGEYLRHAALADDALIGRGQCIEGHGASEAYLPFLDAIGQLASGPRGSAAVRALRQEAPTWVLHMPGLAEGAPEGVAAANPVVLTRERMLRELTNALDRIGTEQSVVISLEDLHWSDHSTLDALEMLCRRESDARVLVLGTLRTGDIASGAHPVHSLAAELTARGHATTIALRPLDEPSIRRVIEGRATAPLGSEVAAVVAARSGGNPLFATSLVEQWSPESPPPGGETVGEGVPESLKQLVASQLEHITPEQRRVMEAAAVAGETLTPGIAAAISGLDLEQVEEILDACARKGQFLRRRGAFEWPDGDLEDEYQFIHSLFREIVIGGLPLGRRTRMHRTAGEVLTARLGDQAQRHIDEIATHFVLGGDAERAVPALVAAARRARSRSAQREARDHLERALALLPRISDEEARARLELDAQALLGAVLIALDGWAAPSIQATYERALDLVRHTEDRVLIREILSGLATTHEFRGEYEEAQRIITEQISLTPPGALPSPESHELLACSLFHQGQLHRSLEEARKGLAVAQSVGGPAAWSVFGQHPATACRMWLAQASWFLGDVRTAMEYVRESIETAPDDFSLLHAHDYAGMIAQYSGDVRGARHHARRMFALARELGFESHEISSGLLRAWAEGASGYAEALPLLALAVDTYRSSGMRMDLPWVLAVQADALIANGRLDEARAALDEAFQVRDPGRGYVFEPEMWRLLGRIEELRGDVAGAADRYRSAVAAARRQEARTPELRSLAALVATGRAEPSEVDRLTALEAELAEIGLASDLEAARIALGQSAPLAS